MSYYTKCPTCGSNLDPGERCDCIDVTEMSMQQTANIVSKGYELEFKTNGKIVAVKEKSTRASA